MQRLLQAERVPSWCITASTCFVIDCYYIENVIVSLVHGFKVIQFVLLHRAALISRANLLPRLLHALSAVRRFVIHRNTEWAMLMLGESVFSLLIVRVRGSADFYITFMAGCLTVSMVYIHHFINE